MAKFIMKNGCCRDCMKAFSKTGKVRIPIFIMFSRAAYAKSQDSKEEPLSQSMAANTVDVKDATL
jgi:hypothetical protein